MNVLKGLHLGLWSYREKISFKVRVTFDVVFAYPVCNKRFISFQIKSEKDLHNTNRGTSCF
jgi:hypothetical protein